MVSLMAKHKGIDNQRKASWYEWKKVRIRGYLKTKRKKAQRKNLASIES